MAASEKPQTVTTAKKIEANKTLEIIMQKIYETVTYDFGCKDANPIIDWEDYKEIIFNIDHTQKPDREKWLKAAKVATSFLLHCQAHEKYPIVKNEIAVLFNIHTNDLLPYLDNTLIDKNVFSEFLRLKDFFGSPQKKEDQIEFLYTNYVTGGKYNAKILTDFFIALPGKFPSDKDFMDHCDHRIEFIEQIRLLIELVL